MVVDQDGERVGRRFAEQGDLEDIACRCPVGAGHDDGTRAGGESVPALTAVEESDVDAAGVRGVVVDDPVIQLSQRRVVQQFPQDIAVLHFRESQYIRHVALPLSDPEQGLRDRPGVLGHFQGVGQTSPVMVACRRQKDLCLVLIRLIPAKEGD